MTRIVSPAVPHRYRRPAKKPKAIALEGPRIVWRGKPIGATQSKPEPEAQPQRSAIIVRGGGDAPEMTREEHKRRGDAAEALFRELVRGAAGDG